VFVEERLLSTLTKGDWGRYRPIVEELLEDHDAVDVAAAALSLVVSSAGGLRRGRARVAAAAAPVESAAPVIPDWPPARLPDERRPARPARDRPDDDV